MQTCEVQEINKLTMELYLNRMERFIKFNFSRISGGWLFDLQEISLVTDKDAIAFFKHLRERDGLSFPSSIGVYFEHLWELVGDGKISLEELQGKINELSFWVSENEKFKPQW